MPSAKYIGYLGGAAVAAGVGAAIAVAGPGTAHAETDGTKSSSASSSESKATSSEAKATERADKVEKADKADKKASAERDRDTVEAGPKRQPVKPKFDPADAVKELTRHFGVAKPTKTDDESADAADADVDAEKTGEATQSEEIPAVAEPEDAPETKPTNVFQPLSDLATKASETAAVLAKPLAVVSDVKAEQDVEVAPPWSPNPFRPMPPEPAPNDMPGLIWNIEQTVVNTFEPVPFLKPFVREGFEGGFRGSQMIPFVNAVIPVANIAGQLPNLDSGDPAVFRNATQSIINNLIATLHPVSVLYYGYDEIADLINLEYEAQQLKEGLYTTTWDILDPFALLHNTGQSGLPLSPSSPTSATPQSTPAVKLAAAASDIGVTTDDPGSNPFRADDPDPIGMPASLIEARNFVILFLPPELKPVYREGFELVYRVSQMVPVVNMAIPITEIVPAFIQALRGDKAGAQIAINRLLLTTGPVSVLYYGFDQIADLLNVEDAGFAAKEQLYINLWDSLDPNGLLHNEGESGLRPVVV